MLQAFHDNLTADESHQLRSVDLYADPPPYYDEHVYKLLWQPDSAAEDGGHASSEYMLRHCGWFREADLVVVAAPVWNFSVPAALKAWIDLIIAPGQTYQFGARGIEPLHRVQRLLLLISSGGRRERVDADNHFSTVIMAPFKYIGITDIDVIWADGQEPSLFDDHQECLQDAVDESGRYARDLGSG